MNGFLVNFPILAIMTLFVGAFVTSLVGRRNAVARNIVVAVSVTAALGMGLIPQLIAMALCSLLSIYFIRPVALRYLHRNDENRVSNADALMGRIGHVSQTIEAGDYGRVAIDGDDWKAVAANGERIEKGEKVKVVGRESIIITVEKVENQ